MQDGPNIVMQIEAGCQVMAMSEPLHLGFLFISSMVSSSPMNIHTRQDDHALFFYQIRESDM